MMMIYDHLLHLCPNTGLTFIIQDLPKCNYNQTFMFDWTEYLQFFSWLKIRPDCELETRRIYSYISYWANNFILCDQTPKSP